MLIWHPVFGILVIAIALSVASDPAGRVAPIVFRTATGEVVVGTTVVLVLLQTAGAISEAKGLPAHVGAPAATSQVLAVTTFVMTGLLFVGVWLIRAPAA
jgi:hypothetical protein